MFQVMFIASHPVALHHWEDFGSIFSLPPGGCRQQRDLSFLSSSPGWTSPMSPTSPCMPCAPALTITGTLLWTCPGPSAQQTCPVEHWLLPPVWYCCQLSKTAIHPTIWVVNKHIRQYCGTFSLPVSQTLVLQACGWRESLPAADTGHKLPASPILRVSKMLLVHPWPLTFASPRTVWLGLFLCRMCKNDPVEIQSLLPDATQSAHLLLLLLKRLLQTWNLQLRFRRDMSSSSPSPTWTWVNRL